MKLLLALTLAALTAFAFACGDDDDGSDNGGGETASPTAAPTDSNGDGETVAIQIENFAFDPTQFTVPAGEEITFTATNGDGAGHTFTVYTDADHSDAQGVDIRLGADESGSDSATFEAGEYFFRCDLHPTQMQGSFTAE